MKKTFITFGGPTVNYHQAVKRIYNQAESFNLFDNIIGYTEKDLMKDSTFWNKHKNFIKNNPRGYGYWIWKSYLILKTLKKMKDGDLLFYLDSGCELNILGRDSLALLFEKKFVKPILVKNADLNEFKNTKMDLVYSLGLENEFDLLNEKQLEAGVLIIVKNYFTVNLFKEFYSICSDNYSFLDDTPSKHKNNECFLEHHHDQSIFSLLVKKHNLYDSCLEKYSFDKRAIWSHNRPIAVIRNRSGKSLLPLYSKIRLNSIYSLFDSRIGVVGIFLKNNLSFIYNFLKPFFPDKKYS